MDPIDHIQKLLVDRGWKPRDLLPAFGGCRGRMSEALNRKRPLSLSQIRCLVFNYGMKAHDLIPWYPTTQQPEEPFNIFDVVPREKKAATEKARLKSVA